jgi:hypothetical protein
MNPTCLAATEGAQAQESRVQRDDHLPEEPVADGPDVITLITGTAFSVSPSEERDPLQSLRSRFSLGPTEPLLITLIIPKNGAGEEPEHLGATEDSEIPSDQLSASRSQGEDENLHEVTFN